MYIVQTEKNICKILSSKRKYDSLKIKEHLGSLLIIFGTAFKTCFEIVR